ncbi:MAG: dihydrolipoyl dehydrogenase [Myxococcota bacterium]
MVMGSLRQKTELVIIGGGPGGYVAAIRAADLGKEVILIEERERLGGVCLNEGCIPSKALINAVETAEIAKDANKFGLTFEKLSLDTKALVEFTESVVDGLTKGVAGLLRRRGVEVIKGRARFETAHSLALEDSDVSRIDFDYAIIATGSRPVKLPFAEKLELWDSSDALKVSEVPQRLLVVGGGYIGMELGLLYSGLGSKVTMVEFFPRLIPGADYDLVEVVAKNCKKRFEAIFVESKVASIEKSGDGFVATVEYKGESNKIAADRILVAVGRKPNSDSIGIEDTGIELDEKGFIKVDAKMRTNYPHIFAIGDVVAGPMLAHKASREGQVAAEVIAGRRSEFDNRAIPAAVFTEPEIAWVGLTEREAEERGIKANVGKFPLRALGRARTLGRTDGFVKILSEPESGLVLGVGMVGTQASEMIAEATLALEMGATLEDLKVTIHPHPTISEAIMSAAEVASGEPIHLDPEKKK